MSAIFRNGLGEAIKKLESPERIERHDPEKIFEHINISQCLTIADLGCGTGFFSVPASEIAGNGEGTVYCIDSISPVLQVLRDKIHSSRIMNLNVIQSDVRKTPFENGTMDLVIMANIFYDLPKDEILSEIRRIMSVSGRLLIVEWKKIGSSELGPPIRIRVSQDDASEFLLESDYELLEMFDASPTHYCIISRPSRVLRE